MFQAMTIEQKNSNSNDSYRHQVITFSNNSDLFLRIWEDLKNRYWSDEGWGQVCTCLRLKSGVYIRSTVESVIYGSHGL